MASTNEVGDKNNFGYDGEELDPNDPNYVYQKHASKYMELFEEMPEGWIKNDHKDKNYKAPYIHPSTGKESWQHPNRPKMDEVTKEINKEVTVIRAEAPTKHQRSFIKKLRMMLQNGIPRGAVEQRAKLEGVNMAYVIGEKALDGSDDEKKSSESDNEINDPFMKKYKRMIKSGVPWGGVKNTIMLDGRWKPEQVKMALSDIIEEKEPIATATTEKEKDKKKLERNQDEEKECSDGDNKFFTPIQDGKKVSFKASSTSQLCSLVRRMAQTIQKTSSHAGPWTTVDSLTLYHALGSLKGIQVARDTYNSTTTNDKALSFQEIRGKRQAFGEIARSIGMKVPKKLTERVTIEGLDELVAFVEKTYEKELMERKAKLDDGLYDFDSFAMLYPPGSRVVAKNAAGGGIDMLCQVAWNRFEQGKTITGEIKKYFKVCFQFVVAVGSSHATIAETVEGMESFEGSRYMKTALTFVPMIAYTKEEQERLTAQYRRRGELYNQVALCGKHAYMAYDKGSFFLKRGGSNSRGNSAAALATGGRVIVDTQGAYDYGHSLGTGYDNMVTGIKYKYKEYSLHLRSVKQDQKNNAATNGAAYADDTGLILFDKVPDDYLEMVWPMVVGFSLTAKAWGDVLVDGLEQIKFQENIFNHLVLPEKRKMMVKALVRHSSSNSNTFCDLVEGKGEGTVFLLYGPPGVGKTLTAEAVAELLHKPLYSVSMGSLGTTPSELEERMGQIMTMSSKWDSLILLDEADSFLETRSLTASSLERNAMVSVMLKLVEYFSGILFLTSNRIDSLDPAFQTRITLALRYSPLNRKARAQVWKNLLTKSGFDEGVATNEIDPEGLSANPLNGREIKNALRLAMAMAAEMRRSLSQDILLETIEIINDYKTIATNED